MIIHSCQLCESGSLERIIDLGYHPLADTFLKPDMLQEPETRYPLRVLLCRDCGHTMLEYQVPPTERYQKVDYSYTSANSPVAVKHFNEMAQQIVQSQSLTQSDLVVDVGSNDGTLLQAFRDQTKCCIMGIDPSANIAQLANNRGIPTELGFFSQETIQKIIDQHGQASIVTATNVFNHIDDLKAFMADLNTLLVADGVFVFEAPYLLHLVQKTAFDTIYLEHISYFSIAPLKAFFRRYGYRIIKCEENDYMGGSIRVYIQRNGTESPDVDMLIQKETQHLLHQPVTYAQFMQRVQGLKFNLCNELYVAKQAGAKIIGIGAATKGNTLLNYCAIDSSVLEFVTDSSPLKIGKFTPGSHIPIRADKDITRDITYAVILPWNIAEFLKEKLQSFNLTFITPRINNIYEKRTS